MAYGARVAASRVVVSSAVRWQRVKDLFHRAIDLPPEERELLLRRECGEDHELRDEVLSLLAADLDDDDFLEKPYSSIYDIAALRADGVKLDRIGPYRLIRVIGSGGMGVVYEAERDDENFSQKVAVKLIKRGMDSELIVRRFRQERQILASLNHRNIARLLDGGTTSDGQLYLVMEYVEGDRIDEFVARQKPTLTRTLALFRGVCSAVQFAHQNLVVHRDLKPSNILVTAAGDVKLLDFGVAKLMRSDAEINAPMTAAADRVLTPAYASPEQIRGEPVNTLSDVYSLGVILYELVAGRKPFEFDSNSLDDVARIISQETPSRPSDAISQENRGSGAPRTGASRMVAVTKELDHIVLMAMRKEPERRYQSAAALSDDIRRFVEGHPIVARRDTPGYRLRKFVTRHRALTVAAATVVAALATGVSLAFWQAREATSARAVAEARLGDVYSLTRTLIFDVHNAIADLPGATAARTLVVERAINYLDGLAEGNSHRADILRDVADAYVQLALVQGQPNGASGGDLPGASASLKRALTIASEVVARDPDDSLGIRSLAIVREKLGDVTAWMGDVTGGVAHARQALEGFEKLARANPSSERALLSVAISHLKLGDLLGNPNYSNMRDMNGAMNEYDAAASILAGPPLATSREARVQRYRGLVHERRGALFKQESHWDAAIKAYKEALAISEQLLATDSNSANNRRDVAVRRQVLCDLRRNMNDLTGAASECSVALEIFRSLSAADASNAQSIDDLARMHATLALLHASSGQMTEAVASARLTIEHRERLLATQPMNDLNRRLLVRAHLEILPHFSRIAIARRLNSDERRAATASLLRAQQLIESLAEAGADVSEERGLLGASQRLMSTL